MKNKAQNEAELVNQVLNVLEKETCLRAVYAHGNVFLRDVTTDGTLRVRDDINAPLFNVEIKLTINEFTIAKVAAQNNKNPETNLLITKHVTPTLAKIMRDRHIQFIDMAGNAYINRPPIYIFMYGNKAGTDLPGQNEAETENIFGAAGIRVVFALLCKENLVKCTYREIAEAAEVALGTVVAVMRDLTRKNYLIELADRGRTLVQKQELADKWANAYVMKYRAKTFRGRYTAARELFWRDTDIRALGAYWGGEVAANKLTNYLKPEVITIFMRQPVDDLMKTLRLRKDDKGAIELREQFWNFTAEDEDTATVHPLLVYADLLAIGDTRALEAAELINDILKRHFK
ncbi:MAG: type IV toxin-antitoxin system AbiEi family antitoxin [Ignavibacteriales bacterium]|nr:type IV toxin-antitoxin system AbiEi family antitoxin [Ignavibacteriales bacterium]